jgi:acetyltransferase-like isoleucine patch superfamily enzyme
MIFANINLGENVQIDTTSNFNNVILGDNVKIAKYCSVFGSDSHPAVIGEDTNIAMMSILNGYDAPLIIGKRGSIAQHVNIMTGNGPQASPRLQKIFPIQKGPVTIGDDCWIGADSIIMPNVTLGSFCVVASNSFVNKSFPDFSLVGGTPAKLIRSFTDEEIKKLLSDD